MRVVMVRSIITVEPLLPIDRFEIFARDLDHPECGAFDRQGNLWAGGEAGQIYRINSAGGVTQVTSLGTFNAGVAFSPGEELFVCNPARGVVRVHGAGGEHDVFATHAGGRLITCANFGLFDRDGNYWMTDSGIWMKRNGALLKFPPDGRGEIVAEMGYANGLALSDDGHTLYCAESDTNRIFRFDTGTGGKDVFAENVGRMPDGLWFDPGTRNLYVGCYASDDLRVLAPDGSQKLFARDPWAILISRPTNMVIRDGYFYVCNLGRTTITRAKL
jgi:gluconolactonase